MQLGLALVHQGVALEATLTVALGMGPGGDGARPRRSGAVGDLVRALSTMPIAGPYLADRRGGTASTVVWAVVVDAFWTATGLL